MQSGAPSGDTSTLERPDANPHVQVDSVSQLMNLQINNYSPHVPRSQMTNNFFNEHRRKSSAAGYSGKDSNTPLEEITDKVEDELASSSRYER